MNAIWLIPIFGGLALIEVPMAAIITICLMIYVLGLI